MSVVVLPPAFGKISSEHCSCREHGSEFVLVGYARAGIFLSTVKERMQPVPPIVVVDTSLFHRDASWVIGSELDATTLTCKSDILRVSVVGRLM